MKVIGDLYKIIPIDPSTPKSTTRSRPGFGGLVQDIFEILPWDEWKPKLIDLIEQNEDVRIAIDTVKGNLFKAVVAQIRQMDEFEVLTDKLKALGLQVDCVISRLENTLGWTKNMCPL